MARLRRLGVTVKCERSDLRRHTGLVLRGEGLLRWLRHLRDPLDRDLADHHAGWAGLASAGPSRQLVRAMDRPVGRVGWHLLNHVGRTVGPRTVAMLTGERSRAGGHADPRGDACLRSRRSRSTGRRVCGRCTEPGVYWLEHRMCLRPEGRPKQGVSLMRAQSLAFSCATLLCACPAAQEATPPVVAFFPDAGDFETESGGAGQPSPARAEEPAGLTRAELVPVIASGRARAFSCFRDQPHCAAKANFRIGPAGVVLEVDARQLSGAPLPEAVMSCLKRVIMGWRFPDAGVETWASHVWECKKE